MAGRISPLLVCGSAYSWKFPVAITAGVAACWLEAVGESMGPVAEDWVTGSPQAARSRESNRMGRIADKALTFHRGRTLAVALVSTALFIRNLIAIIPSARRLYPSSRMQSPRSRLH